MYRVYEQSTSKPNVSPRCEGVVETKRIMEKRAWHFGDPQVRNRYLWDTRYQQRKCGYGRTVPVLSARADKSILGPRVHMIFAA